MPKSKQDKIEKISADTWRIYVREPAERNLANKRILELVAKELSLEIKQIKLISGHQSPNKILSLPD